MLKSLIFCFSLYTFVYKLSLQFTHADQLYVPVRSVRLANRSIYFGIHFNANFYEAASFCQSHGMRLLAVEDEKLNSAIVNYIRTGPYKNGNFWTSGNDLGEEGVFTWLSTGERFRFTNWSKDQPDNFNNVENCVHYWGDHSLQWNDGTCVHRAYFICENIPQI